MDSTPPSEGGGRPFDPGRGYQHSYQDLLAAHDELLPSAGDRVTILHLGAGLDEELGAVYLALAGSTVPLSEEDREARALLAALRTGGDLHPARSFPQWPLKVGTFAAQVGTRGRVWGCPARRMLAA